MKSIPQVYSQCKEEDSDLDVADFVFEHLLNMDSIDTDAKDTNERPHQPAHQVLLCSQVFTVVSAPIRLHEPPAGCTCHAKIYPRFNNSVIPSGFLAEIFHPPSV